MSSSLSAFVTPEERAQAAQAFGRFLAGQEVALAHQRDAAIARLRTPADVLRWQQRVRSRLSERLGDFPERTPLRPRVVGRIERPGFTVEKIILESRPRYYVTANLYLPKAALGRAASPLAAAARRGLRALPAPAILIPCGHAPAGKTNRAYSEAGIALALKGYVALVFDPTGQGERSECIDPATGRHLVRLTVCQHHWTGKPCLLTDTTLAGYRTWDGIRCIDYLLTRPEVDPRRIGVMGNSGGGAMTMLITAVDDRVAVCAASHPGGSCEDMLLRGYQPPDCDLLSLIAPRPCRIIVGNKSGEEEGHRIKLDAMMPFYEAAGCPERLELVMVDGYHDLLAPKREASVEWLNRWLGRVEEDSREPRFRPIAARKLWCTERGQVQQSLGGETMCSLNRVRARRIAPVRVVPTSDEARLKQRAALLAALKARLGFKRVQGALHSKSLGVWQMGDLDVEPVVFESEPDMPVAALLLTPKALRAGSPVVVHACEEGKPKDLAPDRLPVFLARQGFRVLSIDVRDTGEGALCECPPFPDRHRKGLCAYIPELFRREMLAIRALGIGRSRSGMRVLDILRAGDWLKERGLLGKGFAVVGEGRLGIEALKAAAFDPRVVAVAAVRALASYRLITDNPYYNQFQHFWTPGALKDYDIPDLPALVAPRPVAFISAVDHMSRPVSKAELQKRFAWAKAAYSVAGRPDALILEPEEDQVRIVSRVVDALLRVSPSP
jgi:cephalosporin-C deacetylase-like acetyl esterase